MSQKGKRLNGRSYFDSLLCQSKINNVLYKDTKQALNLPSAEELAYGYAHIDWPSLHLWDAISFVVIEVAFYLFYLNGFD